MSIRTKVVVIILAAMVALGGVFLFYAVSVGQHTRDILTKMVQEDLLFESEQINKIITRLEQNALDLAKSGRTYYLARSTCSDTLGEQLVLDNFHGLKESVGGGIWYEPFAFCPERRLFCFYACYDKLGELHYDPDFRSVKYHYLKQSWYTQIKANLSPQMPVTWSEVYWDETGTRALMATAGAGIYDLNGRFVGMSTVDWKIQDVIEQLRKIQPLSRTESSRCFITLVDMRYDRVVANTRNPVGSDAKQTVLQHTSSLPWYRSLEAPLRTEVKRTKLMIDGEEYLSFYRQLENQMVLLVQVPTDEMHQFMRGHNTRAVLVCIFWMLVIPIFAMYFLTTQITRPLKKFMRELTEIGDGNLDVELDVQRHDEIGKFAGAFNQMTVHLKDYIEQLQRETAAKQKIANELEIAASIQMSAMPNVFPPYPDRHEFDLFATMKTAKKVGGDFYDFFLVDNDHLALLIADVSGKGIPAAMFMMTAKTLIENLALTGLDPAAVFEQANNRLCENNDAGMFVTALLGILEISTGRFVFANAGHLPPLWKRNATGRFEWLSLEAASTFVLGALEGLPYQQDECLLGRGEELFFYTDGVTEAVNPTKTLYGAERMRETMNTLTDGAISLPQKLETMEQELLRYCEGEEQADDTTMLIFRYTDDTRTSSRIKKEI